MSNEYLDQRLRNLGGELRQEEAQVLDARRKVVRQARAMLDAGEQLDSLKFSRPWLAVPLSSLCALLLVFVVWQRTVSNRGSGVSSEIAQQTLIVEPTTMQSETTLEQSPDGFAGLADEFAQASLAFDAEDVGVEPEEFSVSWEPIFEMEDENNENV